jgi:uncharacterized protein (TIGR00661 family)
MKEKKVLFLANGLGMGNSTRCYAVIERLVENGASVDVMTSGNGVKFFSEKQGKGINRLIETKSFKYAKDSSGKLSAVKTILSIFQLAAVYIENNRLVKRYIKENKPSIVVTDSEYVFLPMWFSKTPIVALNNSDMVVTSFFKFPNKPFSIYPQFFLVEFFDFMFHLIVADKVISPRLDCSKSFGKKFVKVPPIVRKDVAGDLLDGDVKNGVIMLSGSTFGSNVDLHGEKFPFQIDVIGREGESSEGLTYHGKLVDNLHLLNKAGFLVINAGFSAVSEGVCMRKPLIVIPVENHAEQFINAKMVENLGIGFMSSAEEMAGSIKTINQKIEEFRDKCKELHWEQNGAEEASRVILSFFDDQK